MLHTYKEIPDPLKIIFRELNRKHFDSLLEPPKFKWNHRLRAAAGRFIPGDRRWFLWSDVERPPIVEFASYLLEEPNALELIRDTMAHELIHYWLWANHRPYGHTREFMAKLKEIGASRWNPVPRNRPVKFAYRCSNCPKEFYTRRKLKPKRHACQKCCKEFANGKYDARFILVFDRELMACESLEFSQKRRLAPA